MLVYAVENPRGTLFKEENGKRTLTLLNISSVQQAYNCFMQMQWYRRDLFSLLL